MKIEHIIPIISIVFTIIGGVIGYFAFRRNQKKKKKKDTQEDTKSKVELNTKLDLLLSNNAELKSSFKEMDKKLDDFKDNVNERLTRVEESCKQAHKRLDMFEIKEK